MGSLLKNCQGRVLEAGKRILRNASCSPGGLKPPEATASTGSQKQEDPFRQARQPSRVLRFHYGPWTPLPRRSEPKPFPVWMWRPRCTPDEQPFCKDMLPRLDAIHYKPSDRRKSCQQRTWVECARAKERIKKLCCLERIQPPEVLKRVKQACPKVACRFDYLRMRHVCVADHVVDPEGKCSSDASCRRTRRATKCPRLRTPYPCFSDRQQRQKPSRLSECDCMERPGRWMK